MVSRSDVLENYAADGLTEAVLAQATARAGGEPLTAEHLARFDQFHLGGAVATSWVETQLGAGPGQAVLDVGSGLGGPARLLAGATGAHVTGVDLTPHHVDGAVALSRSVAMQDRTTFVLGDATRLPFGLGAFDAAVMLFVGMNVEDKPALVGEVRRVLRDGGRFVVFDPVRIGDGQPEFPVPWAAGPSSSHLGTREEYAAVLTAAGFRVDAQRGWCAEVVQLAEQQDSDMAARVAMGRLQYGDEAPVRFSNLLRAVRGGVVQPRMFVATAA